MHPDRAEKFGTQYKDPGRVRKDFKLVMEARQERLKANHGFTTGDIDLFSEVGGGCYSCNGLSELMAAAVADGDGRNGSSNGSDRQGVRPARECARANMR